MSSLHQHAKDLFIEALARTPEERQTFLADACGTDAALRQEVESLLAFHSAGSAEGVSFADTGSEPAASAAERSFEPGQVFAGRYRMIARIGRGGMGDVWRADDLVLGTPVALKVLRLTGDEAREKILNEVRMARQITHPAICRVFDVGEAEGRVFFTMELVQGENLATLLRRVGRLPQERVVQIGKTLCAGLAAAHAQGVLHRDLKPANILIDDRGRVLITDFGIAFSRDSQRQPAAAGTPDYMAPEQLVGGLPLTERTDIFALGVVLYELLVGRHPFERSEAIPIRPSSRVPNIDRRLERAVMDALATDPRLRPQSAVALAARFEPDVVPAPQASRRSFWIASAAATAVVAGLLFIVFWPRSGGTLTAQDTIVLADFVNTTGEPVFDGALKVALTVALEQSPFLRVFSDDRVAETLRLMGRAPDSEVTRAVAREVAQRQQLKAFVVGSIARLGRNYVIALEAINARTGDAMARQQVEAASQEEVLSALGTAVSAMRGTLGESLASVERFDVSLPRATTASLEALHAYALALDRGTVNPRPEALPHLRRALELDPDFALALAFTATVYSNTGQTLLAPVYAKRAFDLRDRVSERERFFIGFRYYRDALQDWEQALDLSRAWTSAYPREAFAFNALGSALLRFGRYEAAVEPLRQAIVLDPAFAAPYSNLALTFVALDRQAEAGQVIAQAAARQRESMGTRRMAYNMAFMRNDDGGMTAQWSALSALGNNSTIYGWRAHTKAFAGRVAEAHDDFRTGIEQARRDGLNETAAQMAVEDAEIHASVGQCERAVQEVSEAMSWSSDNFTAERAARAVALCGDETETARLSRLLSDRYPQATFTTHVALPVAAAAAALARGQGRQALETLDSVRTYELSPRADLWPWYLRGLAYAQTKDARAAAAEYQRVIDSRSLSPSSQLRALSLLGLARASAAGGDRAAARGHYDSFLSLWQHADPDLAPVAAARAERARLE